VPQTLRGSLRRQQGGKPHGALAALPRDFERSETIGTFAVLKSGKGVQPNARSSYEQ